MQMWREMKPLRRQNEEPGLSYQAQGRMMDPLPGGKMRQTAECLTKLLKLTAGLQPAKVSKGSETGENFSKESELKMLSELGNLPS